jgi:hypothetical protein
MSWYLYDAKGFVDQIASNSGLEDIEQLNIKPLNQVINKGCIETEYERQRVLEAISEYPQLNYLAKIIKGAGDMPLLITDGAGDNRIDKFHPDSEYEDRPTVQSVEDAKPLYEKYVGKWGEDD